MDSIEFNPIGTIHSPFKKLGDMPIQPTGAKDVVGEIHLREEMAAGLQDLDGFSHIHLIYHFHQNTDYELTVIPFMDTVKRGLFSTRAPRRPNMIGMSIVRLEKSKAMSCISGDRRSRRHPPVGYQTICSQIRCAPADRFGWLDENAHKAETVRSDKRFTSEK